MTQQQKVFSRISSHWWWPGFIRGDLGIRKYRTATEDDTTDSEALIQEDSSHAISPVDFNKEKQRRIDFLKIAKITLVASTILATVILCRKFIAPPTALPVQDFLAPALQVLNVSHNSDQYMYYLDEQPCGTTPREAQSRGCVFEVFTYSWLPRQCYSAELEAEFLGYSEWRWWKGGFGMENHPEELTFEQVASGNFTVLRSTWGYHVTHCAFVWRKLLEMTMNGRPVDSYVGNPVHTRHCARRFEQAITGMAPTEDISISRTFGGQAGSEKPPRWDDISVHFRMKFPSCGRYELLADMFNGEHTKENHGFGK